MSIRVAVIGTGVMGADHARIVAEELPGAALHLVCDVDEGRARGVAERLGAQDISIEPDAVAARRDVDAVIIASPDRTHAPLTLACIAAGKPVLCEKPLAADAAGCREVIAAEEKAGKRFVTTGFMRRFDPSYTAMKAALQDGVTGPAVMMHNFHRNVEAPPGFTGAMAITNSAPHEFDIARFVLDTEYCAVTAYQPAGAPEGEVAPVFMVLETTGGQLVTIEVNNNARYGYDVRGELVGAKGSVSLTTPVHAEMNADLRRFDSYAADWRPRFAEAYRLQDKAWVKSITTGAHDPAAASAFDGLAATLVADAAVRSLTEGRKISTEPAQRPAFYA